MSLWYSPPAVRQPPLPVPVLRPQLPGHPFRAWTETLAISAVLRGEQRLSDLLNGRAVLTAEQVSSVPHGSGWAAAVHQDEALLDPFDLDLVLGGALDAVTALERAARRVYKVRYPVLVEGRGFEVRGLVHLFPGNAPEFMLNHTGALFFPVTEALVRRSGRIVSDRATDVALVNRFAVRGIRQLDSLDERAF